MHAATQRLLEKLLAHAESEESNGKRRAFNITESRAAVYLNEPDFEIKRQIHAELKLLARSGSLTIEWDRRAGHENLIKGLSAASADAIAAALGVTRLKTALEDATLQLAAHVAMPRVALALQVWADGRQVRGIGPEDVSKLLDVITLLRRCETLEQPTAVRRISASLFRRSKYVERLVPVIDFMTAESDELALANRSVVSAEVLARIRLIRYAQPILLAGGQRLTFVDGTSRLIASPYEGVAPDSLASIEGTPRYVMTVENLTTFHELSSSQDRAAGALILYTAGQPSPSFIACYQRIAQSTGCTSFLHWGDVDGKGIEIAGRLADALKDAVGLDLALWRMDVEPYESEGDREMLDGNVISKMLFTCHRLGWKAVASAIESHRSRIEQEGEPLIWPSSYPQ